jgi:hypothetical protein
MTLAFLMWTPIDFAKAAFMVVIAIGIASRIEDWFERVVRWLWKKANIK